MYYRIIRRRRRKSLAAMIANAEARAAKQAKRKRPVKPPVRTIGGIGH